jgi:pimeloyl-ACP methyl ester carboxylesterase
VGRAVRRLGVALALALVVPAAPAAALDRYVPMKVPPGPGPAKYDRVFVKQLGPERARTVLVLVPGTNGGAGSILPVAREIVRRVPRMQVWIVDRREQAFEDTSVFRTGDPQRAQDYYLGFQYKRVAGEDARFVADWGLKLQLTDLRGVIERARAGGRRVLLGGHSAGASTAVAYAAWDFGGRPGYRELTGLVLIDGGLLGSFRSADLAHAKARLAKIRGGKVFNDILGLGIPEINGIFTEVGALWAHKRPNEPSVLQEYPALPASVKPRVRVTNEALLGYAFDETTSPDFLDDIHVHAGRLARSGNPRGWVDGELTSIRRLAKAWAAEAPNATEWYYPRRLRLDLDAASPLRQNAAARYLGLRLLHAAEIDVPLYAYSSVMTRGRVARGARRLARMSRIEHSTVVDDRNASHLDPLSAAPRTNRFLKTVVPFLRRVAP